MLMLKPTPNQKPPKPIKILVLNELENEKSIRRRPYRCCSLATQWYTLSFC